MEKMSLLQPKERRNTEHDLSSPTTGLLAEGISNPILQLSILLPVPLY